MKNVKAFIAVLVLFLTISTNAFSEVNSETIQQDSIYGLEVSRTGNALDINFYSTCSRDELTSMEIKFYYKKQEENDYLLGGYQYINGRFDVYHSFQEDISIENISKHLYKINIHNYHVPENLDVYQIEVYLEGLRLSDKTDLESLTGWRSNILTLITQYFR